MYPFLLRHLPRFWANLLIVFWYLLLIILIIAFFSYQQADFRYANV
jgi:hypothetical protein